MVYSLSPPIQPPPPCLSLRLNFYLNQLLPHPQSPSSIPVPQPPSPFPYHHPPPHAPPSTPSPQQTDSGSWGLAHCKSLIIMMMMLMTIVVITSSFNGAKTTYVTSSLTCRLTGLRAIHRKHRDHRERKRPSTYTLDCFLRVSGYLGSASAKLRIIFLPRFLSVTILSE